MICPGLFVLAALALFAPMPAQSFPGSAYPDTQEILATSGDGFIEEINGLPVLHVKGSPREMGRQYGILAGDRVERAVDMLEAIVERDRGLKGLPMWLVRSLRKITGFVFWFTFPDEVRQEIEGMVEGARERGHRYALRRRLHQ